MRYNEIDLVISIGEVVLPHGRQRADVSIDGARIDALASVDQIHRQNA